MQSNSAQTINYRPLDSVTTGILLQERRKPIHGGSCATSLSHNVLK